MRPKIMNERIAMNVMFDSKELREFEEIVGKGNISKEIRAMIKDHLETRKKEEGQQSDLLNLPNINNNPELVSYITNYLFERLSKVELDVLLLINNTNDTMDLVKISEKMSYLDMKAKKQKKVLIDSGNFLVNGKMINKYDN